MTAAEYLTPDQIRQRLIHRRAGRGLTKFHAEVERLSGMTISQSHLANILSAEKNPNACVMKYLGGERIEKQVVYQIDRAEKRSAKSKPKVKH